MNPNEASNGKVPVGIDYVKVGASQGWQCPICGNVYSPWQYECTQCNHDRPTTITATTEIWPEEDHSTGGKP